MPAGKTYPLSLILSAVDKASATISKVNAGLGNVGKVATRVGRSMTTSLSLPIVGVGVAATKATADFEKGMASVSTLIDTNTESLSAMGNEVLRIGQKTPVAVEDLTGALYDVRSAGVSAADQFEVLEGSARLAVAGLGSTKEAVDLVTSATNAFGLEGEDASQVYDQIFKTVQFGKTNIAELAQGFGAVAGQVAATGTPLDEYLASVSALTTTGLPAAQAHRQLRAVISGLTRDTKGTREVFRKLGASDLKDLIAKSGGLVGAMRAVSGELGGNEAKMLKLVGSTEALNAMLGLTGKQAATFDTTLSEMRTGANSVDAAFAKQSKTTAASLQRTKNAVLSAAVAIGGTLAPFVERLSVSVREAAAWFRGLDAGTQGFILKAAGITAVVGPTILFFGKLFSALSLVGAGIGKVVTAFKVLRVVFMANPLGAAVALLATAATMIIAEWEYFEQFFALLWKGVKSLFADAWAFIEPIVNDIMGAVDRVQGGARWLQNLIVDDDIGTRPIAEVRREMGLTPPPPPGGVNRAKVEIEVKGQPGTRVDVDPASDADVDVGLGMSMAPI